MAQTVEKINLTTPFRSTATRKDIGDRPIRNREERLCLSTYVRINGIDAYTLFDTGNTTDIISPEFITWRK